LSRNALFLVLSFGFFYGSDSTEIEVEKEKLKITELFLPNPA
jgi:hypothetical protein